MGVPGLAMYKQNGYTYFLENCTICRKTCSATITTMKNFPFSFSSFNLCFHGNLTLASPGQFRHHITTMVIISSGLNQIV